MSAESEIEEIVHRETRAWDTRDADLLVSIFHPDIVWPWPPGPHAHDPADWVFVMGRFDRERWRRIWQELFDTHELVHNRRRIVRIQVTDQRDGAFAVVDVDTLWRAENGTESRWLGRACKIYVRIGTSWKMISQVGLLLY